MDALAILSAMYVALWISVYTPAEPTKEPTTTLEVREQEYREQHK